jgi:hypothetical protein
VEATERIFCHKAIYLSLLIKQNHNLAFSIHISFPILGKKSFPKNTICKLIWQSMSRALPYHASPNVPFFLLLILLTSHHKKCFLSNILHSLFQILDFFHDHLTQENNAILCSHLLTMTKLFTQFIQKCSLCSPQKQIC